MGVRENLLKDIGSYVRVARIKETTFGRLAVNDGKFVGRLRSGKQVTLKTVDRVYLFIGDNPPAARKRLHGGRKLREAVRGKTRK